MELLGFLEGEFGFGLSCKCFGYLGVMGGRWSDVIPGVVGEDCGWVGE